MKKKLSITNQSKPNEISFTPVRVAIIIKTTKVKTNTSPTQDKQKYW
jgi:hypothetical protein